MWLILEENSFNFNEKHFVQTYGIAIKGVARGVLGCPWPHLLQAFFNQTTYNRWRKCHDDTLAIVTIWWIPSLWQSVTPPLWKILATPLIAMGTKMAVAFSVFFLWRTLKNDCYSRFSAHRNPMFGRGLSMTYFLCGTLQWSKFPYLLTALTRSTYDQVYLWNVIRTRLFLDTEVVKRPRLPNALVSRYRGCQKTSPSISWNSRFSNLL